MCRAGLALIASILLAAVALAQQPQQTQPAPNNGPAVTTPPQAAPTQPVPTINQSPDMPAPPPRAKAPALPQSDQGAPAQTPPSAKHHKRHRRKHHRKPQSNTPPTPHQ